MSDPSIARNPIDIVSFTAKEYEQFTTSLANDREALKRHSHLQGLYEAAMSNMRVPENDMVVFQLLAFTHYHFLFSTASRMRCHLSEAFGSARVAIDAALIAAQIIYDRASQVAYLNRQKPFDKLNRHLGNLVTHAKPLPHHLVPALLQLHGKISSFASHADVNTFVHRSRIVREPDVLVTVEYFQFADNEVERRIHELTLAHIFVMVLDVFSDFLIIEQRMLPEQWRVELHGLGRAIERQNAELQALMYPEDSAPPQDGEQTA